MVRDFSKLMLRAYNAEADNLVRGLKPYKLDSAVERLGKVASTIAKLGKTMHIRRLNPLDRVKEFSDASVPFNFDAHALFFSDDAVGVEAKMHARLADRRVNPINQRRQFFYATPQEAKEHLLELRGSLLQYEEIPEALEYRQSLTQAKSR
jgi:hypothetical protein